MPGQPASGFGHCFWWLSRGPCGQGPCQPHLWAPCPSHRRHHGHAKGSAPTTVSSQLQMDPRDGPWPWGDTASGSHWCHASQACSAPARPRRASSHGRSALDTTLRAGPEGPGPQRAGRDCWLISGQRARAEVVWLCPHKGFGRAGAQQGGGWRGGSRESTSGHWSAQGAGMLGLGGAGAGAGGLNSVLQETLARRPTSGLGKASGVSREPDWGDPSQQEMGGLRESRGEGLQHLGPGVPQVALRLPWCLPAPGLQGTTGAALCPGGPGPGLLGHPEPRELLAPGPTPLPRVCWIRSSWTGAFHKGPESRLAYWLCT